MPPGWRSRAAHGIATAVVDHRAFAIARRLRRRAGRSDRRASRPTSSRWPASCASSAPAFVRRYEGRLVNIHPSLLPAFPGLHTHRRAIEAGCKVAGATVHFVTADLDHGPIVAPGGRAGAARRHRGSARRARARARARALSARGRAGWSRALRARRRRRRAHATASRSCCSDAEAGALEQARRGMLIENARIVVLKTNDSSDLQQHEAAHRAAS